MSVSEQPQSRSMWVRVVLVLMMIGSVRGLTITRAASTMPEMAFITPRTHFCLCSCYLLIPVCPPPLNYEIRSCVPIAGTVNVGRRSECNVWQMQALEKTNEVTLQQESSSWCWQSFQNVEQGTCSFLATSKGFFPLLIMPPVSRTEASATRAIYSSYAALTRLTYEELPFKALEASFFDATLHPLNFLSRALQGVGQSNPYKTLYVLGPCFFRAR